MKHCTKVFAVALIVRFGGRNEAYQANKNCQRLEGTSPKGINIFVEKDIC